jgi:hypothetical protein
MKLVEERAMRFAIKIYNSSQLIKIKQSEMEISGNGGERGGGGRVREGMTWSCRRIRSENGRLIGNVLY